MAETRQEKFKIAQEARKHAKAEQGGYGGNSEVPDFQYVDIGQNKCVVVRLLGESIETRNKPTDALMVERSMILGDDNKSWFTCVWDKDSDWPMRQLMRTLAKYKWNKELNSGKGGRVYTNDGCELLKRFNTNNQSGAFPSGMEPRKWVMINCIDRMDDWCKENKHSKLLSWNANQVDDKVYYTNGITQGMYSLIFDTKCTEVGDHFEYVDFVIRRYNEHTRPNQDTNYEIYWHENKTPITRWGEKDGQDYFNKIVVGDLTSEEENYERYALENIPFNSKPTPAGIILSKLGKFIKDVDKKYDINIYEQLVEQKAKEKEQWELEKKDKETKTFVESGTKKEEEKTEAQEELPNGGDVEQPQPEVKHQKKLPVKESKSVQLVASDITLDMIELFPGLELIKDIPTELALIKKVDMENQEIIWNVKADVECAVEECKEMLPQEAEICIYCGQDYRG